MAFLAVTMQELYDEEVYSADFVVVSADAYVDHPSFGAAVVARLMQSFGFSIGFIPQPTCDEDFTRFGKPNKAFLVSGGVVDSMVNNYTVALNKREGDVYSEGGIAGKRPDRATSVYSNKLKELYPDSVVIIGGIEASLRRLSHYDYWSDEVMQSILISSKADLLIYGMGEKPLTELAKYAERNVPLNKVRDIRGTAYVVNTEKMPAEIKLAIESKSDKFLLLSSHDRVKQDKQIYAKAFMTAYNNTDPFQAKGLVQKQDYDNFVVVNPPAMPLTEKEMDYAYALPYERKAHPMYKLGVPAIEEVEYSVTAHRGCFGSCSFCALTYHQGRIIQSRSDDSIIAEVERLSVSPDFKGYINDIGGATANFHAPACKKQLTAGACGNKECIGFKPCPNLVVSHEKYLNVLRRARAVKGVKKVFIRSGVRYDYLMMDKNKEFFNELVKYHISGQLKVAPEHCSDCVLELMNKPEFKKYLEFAAEFDKVNERNGKKQFLVPYLISSHPGTTLADAIKLTEYLKSIGYMPKQVQDFYPTPSTLSTTMYYTELDPRTMEKVFVPKTREDKAMQRALLQYRLEFNKPLIRRALIKAERLDLIPVLIGEKLNVPPRLNGSTKNTEKGDALKGETGVVVEHKDNAASKNYRKLTEREKFDSADSDKQDEPQNKRNNRYFGKNNKKRLDKK